jgi:hypothetical protein
MARPKNMMPTAAMADAIHGSESRR